MTSDDRYFSAVAESYDRLQPVVAGPAYRAGLDFVIKLIPRGPEDAFTCVELGCGTATLTESVLQQFPAATCLAIDNEPAMLEIARRKLAAYDDRAEARMAEAATADMPASDVVLSSFMLHHVSPEQVPPLFSRVASSLSPGGCFILLDTMQLGPRWAGRIGARNRRLSERHIAEAIAAGLATQEEIDSRWAHKRAMKQAGKDVEYSHRAEDLAACLERAGFAETGLLWRQFAFTLLIAFVKA